MMAVEAFNVRNWRADLKPIPAFPPVMIMVLPARLVPGDVGGI